MRFQTFACIIVLNLISTVSISQKKTFTHADTLRGSNGEYRQKWDVLHYDITVEPDFKSKSLLGKNIITFFDNGAKQMQIDLQEPMILDSAINNDRSLAFSREGNVYWLQLRDTAAMYKIKPDTNQITLYFHGKPKEAKNPPWDGGWIWKLDKMGRPWMSVACQGDGASLWYPCKDIQADEPDLGATLRIITPSNLTGIGNGRLISKNKQGDKSIFRWEVSSPINNYNIVPYIGAYTHFGEIYDGEKGKLSMDYYVLDYNLEKAKKQFTDAPRTMKAFEHWFGPYPFYKDGYKLVESPHLGMEHQSAVAYGNGYQNGYYGKDLSGSGWGNKWDFIIVHETAHEWFGNNITSADIADMWVHEGFTHYSETLFTEYYFGSQAGTEYISGTRKKAENDVPVTGIYGVNSQGSGDMYFKAAGMIHTIRTMLDDDEKFRNILREMNSRFYHQVVTAREIREYLKTETKLELEPLFIQYLQTIMIPKLEYKITGDKLSFRYIDVVEGFNMALKVSGSKDGKYMNIQPSAQWQTVNWTMKDLVIHPGYYVIPEKVF